MNEASGAREKTLLEFQRELRQFLHDCKSPLSVICTGLEALEMVRNDRENFAQLCRMMRSAANELKDQLSCLGSEASTKNAADVGPGGQGDSAKKMPAGGSNSDVA